MISSQRGSDEPSQVQIEELIRLFGIYIDGPEGCRERSYRLLERYPRSRTVIQIAAACDSMVGKYSQAIAGYQKCIEIDPKTLAYSNNQAWNLIQQKEYEIAMTLLSDIKDKWNHPAIYSNWAKILQNLDGNHVILEETLKKRYQFLKDYPQYIRKGDNDLIHTFLLEPEENYTREIEELRIQIFQLVEVLRRIQTVPLNIQTLKERLQFMQDKIKIRKEQEQKSGILIDPLLKIAMAGLELLHIKILNNYQQNYSDQLEKYVLKSIEIINDNLFCQKIESNFNYKDFQENKLIPTVFQLQEIGEYMQEKLKQLNPQYFRNEQQQQVQKQKPIPINLPKAEKDQQVQKQKMISNINLHQHEQIQKPKPIPSFNPVQILVQQEPKISEFQQHEDINYNENSYKFVEHVNPLPTQVQKPSNQLFQSFALKPQMNPNMNEDKKLETGYHFYIRLEEVEQIEKQHAQYLVQKLRIQKQNESNPLFVILHFKIKTNDSFIIFINIRRVNQQVRRLPHFADLQRLNTEFEKQQVKRYYLILSNMVRFYDFYGTHNFVYELRNIKSHLQATNYIRLIAPVINHLFADEDIFQNYQVGDICTKIHTIITNYISETKKKGDFLRSFKIILKRLHAVIVSSQNPVQDLLQSLLELKQAAQYIGVFLNNSLLNIDGSTKYHEYFIKRMNNDIVGKNDQNWLIFSISILLLSYIEDNESDESLELRFRYCYYSSRVTEAGRDIMMRKFYSANHQIPLMQRVGAGFKKIVNTILP